MGPQFLPLFASSLADVQISSFPRPVSQPTNFQHRVVILLPPGTGEKSISISDGSTLAQTIRNLQFILVIFNYRCQ